MHHCYSAIFTHPISTISYKVTVSIPQEEAPSKGFPTLYVLDGNAYGIMCKEIVTLQGQRSDKTGVPAMIIVSIGYDVNEIHPPLRVYDFTPPSSTFTLPPRPDGIPWPMHGGAKQFLQFIEQVVQPFVHEQASVDVHQQILFGHSLGGLFALYVLFERPELFQGYISCSPSIWWNARDILNYVQEDCLSNDKKLFIAAERERRNDMYDNALNLYERLSVNYPQTVAFNAPENENHMSIVPTILSEAFRYMF